LHLAVSTLLETEIATAVNLLALSDTLVRLPACSGSRGHPASDETLVEAFSNYQLGIASSSAAAPLWNSYKSALQHLDDLRARKGRLQFISVCPRQKTLSYFALLLSFS
jgi:hypothetical protein